MVVALLVLVEAPRWMDLARTTARLHAGRCKTCAGAARPSCTVLNLDVATTLALELSFPHRVSFRGYVVACRELRASKEMTEWWPWKGKKTVSVVEVVPEKYGEGTYAALGGVLLEDPAGLQRGSVVRVTCNLVDPTSYRLTPLGFIGREAMMQVEVGVRR